VKKQKLWDSLHKRLGISFQWNLSWMPLKSWTNKKTFKNFMDRSPSWETYMFSATQKFPHILWNAEGSSPHSEEPDICPYPEPDQSNLCASLSTSWRFILVLYYHLLLGLPSGVLPSGFPTNPVCISFLPIRATCLANLSLLDLITRMITGEVYQA
jgi:hypothetical protein